MKCPNCGIDNPVGEFFCSDCGAYLQESGTADATSAGQSSVPISHKENTGERSQTGDSTATTSTLVPNTQLQAGRYVVTRILGQGGMGAAVLARDTRVSNKLVVIKELISDETDLMQRQEDLPEDDLVGYPMKYPPYYGNVQYAELMDFCYVWLRKLIDDPAFKHHTTRDQQELTGNVNMERGLDHFTEGLSIVFQKMAKALKPGHPLAFTYHHNSLEAYYPIAVAMLDSGLVCSASLPCPAEMGASIHISGTGSSIVDTVFVCRSTGTVPAQWLAKTAGALAGLVRDDVEKLRQAGLKETRGDVRCIIYGHLIRLAVWDLRHGWDKTKPTKEKTAAIAAKVQEFGGLQTIEDSLNEGMLQPALVRTSAVREETKKYGASHDEISF